MDPRRVIELGLAFQTLFTECNTSIFNELNKVGCWKPPEHGIFILNTNGATFLDQQVADMRAIIRDNNGE